jgi:hypothetical protein
LPDWVNIRSDLSPQGSGYIMLDKTDLAQAPDGAWQTSFTFATNVSSYLGSLRYRKNSHGQVELEGRWLYSGGTASTSNLFQLPVGYRPVSDSSGLNIPRNIPSWIQNGNRSGSYWSAGLTNVYEIVSPVSWLTIGTDGWVSIASPIWGQLSRVGGNPDGGFDMNGQWKSWGQVPWDNLFGRIYNFRFPTN